MPDQPVLEPNPRLVEYQLTDRSQLPLVLIPEKRDCCPHIICLYSQDDRVGCGISRGVKSLTLNGRKLQGHLVPAEELGEDNRVEVVLG